MAKIQPALASFVALLQPQRGAGSIDAKPKSALLPPKDTFKTWGGPESKRDLNFGHHPPIEDQGQPTLLNLHASGMIVWSDTETALTPDQWVNMPKFQQDKLLLMLPEVQRGAFQVRMNKGDARKAHTQPQGVDNSQVSPFSFFAAQLNHEAQSPSSVADRARAALAEY